MGGAGPDRRSDAADAHSRWDARQRSGHLRDNAGRPHGRVDAPIEPPRMPKLLDL